MCRDERPYKAVTFFCKLHGAGRIEKADSKSSGQVIIHHQGRANSSLQSSLLCWDFYSLFSHLVLCSRCFRETPFLCLASVYAQELLDYLKQFDKDGKGALSQGGTTRSDERQDQMWLGFEHITTARRSERSSHFIREINTELMKCGVVDTLLKEGCLSVYGSNAPTFCCVQEVS